MGNKNILIIIFAFILGSSAIAVASFSQPQNNTNTQQSANVLQQIFDNSGDSKIRTGYFIPPTPTPQKETPATATRNAKARHGELFSVFLEYNPEDKKTTLLSMDKVNGMPPYYQKTEPRQKPNTFLYRIEVLSSANKVLATGWEDQHIETIKTPQNTYQFRIFTVYQENALIKIFLPNGQRLWSGYIQ